MVPNHGGRQQAGVPGTFEVLLAIADAMAGRCPVLLDGGVRTGPDVPAAASSV
jgi:(S)-3,5-dihydroxyphenylglycine transaminase